ncbi:MAG: TIR domain-containing protein [Fusobacterium sp.]|nr:TIR domain-containing protein [Fusobacterium sp.]
MENEKTIFISYSWEEPKHNKWVEKLAEKLEDDLEGFTIYIDKNLGCGKDIKEYQKKIKISEKVLVVITPEYTRKADKYIGGVGDETKILENRQNIIIPILRKGENWGDEYIPDYLLGRKGIDMREEDDLFLKEYKELLKELKVVFKEEFLKKINDAGMLKNAYPGREITLEDIYVPPKFELFKESEKAENIEKKTVKNLLENLKLEKNIIIYGDAQSGKTSLSYYLTKELFNRHEIPIYVSGNNLKNIRKNILKVLKEQYYDTDIVKKIEKKDCILIFDDFDLNTEKDLSILLEFKSVILIASSIYKFNYRENVISGYYKYNILEYSTSLRDELINKWASIGVGRRENIIKKNCEIESKHELINATLGKFFKNGFMPSYPFFILSILTASESKRIDAGISSQVSCYSFLVYANLKEANIRTEDIDSYQNILSFLSFYIYNKKDEVLDFKNIEEFFNGYEKIYLLPKEEYKDGSIYKSILYKLQDANILTQDNYDNYKFKYRYLQYYFLAEYLTKKYDENEEKILEILDNLQIEKNAYICTFLAYHTVDNKFIKNLITNSKKLFKNNQEVTLKKEELAFFYKNLQIENFLYLSKDEDVIKNRTKNLELEDKAEETLGKNYNSETIEDATNHNDNELVRDLQKSIRTTQIIGNVVKNRYGTLEINQQKELIQEAIDINLRILDYIFNVIKNPSDQEEMIVWIKNRLEYIMKEENIKIDYFEKAREFFWKINYFIVYSLIYQLIKSIGTKNLNRIIYELSSEKGTPAYSLINHGIKIFYGHDIKVDEIENAFQNYSYSYIAQLIIKQIISEFSYSHSIDYKIKQKIKDKFNIPIGMKME